MNGLQPRKRLGQHFLHDPAVIARIVAAIAPASGDRIVEIGGGLGALTRPLLETIGSLDVVELDPRLADALEALQADFPGLRVHRADALKVDFGSLAGDGTPLRVVGNLPYNISTPLLFHLLEFRDRIRDLHLMLQKEVVDRMAAAPGSKAYGRLTIMLAAWTEVEPLFDVGPGAFRPPPAVRSTVVRLIPSREPRFPLGDEQRFARLVARLFSMRRKTLGRILKGELDAEALIAAGFDPRARPETLAPAEIARLAGLSG